LTKTFFWGEPVSATGILGKTVQSARHVPGFGPRRAGRIESQQGQGHQGIERGSARRTEEEEDTKKTKKQPANAFEKGTTGTNHSGREQAR